MALPAEALVVVAGVGLTALYLVFGLGVYLSTPDGPVGAAGRELARTASVPLVGTAAVAAVVAALGSHLLAAGLAAAVLVALVPPALAVRRALGE